MSFTTALRPLKMMRSSEDKAKKKPVGDCHENHSVEELHDQIDIWDQQPENWQESVESDLKCSRRTNSVGENELLAYASEYVLGCPFPARQEGQ